MIAKALDNGKEETGVVITEQSKNFCVGGTVCSVSSLWWDILKPSIELNTTIQIHKCTRKTWETLPNMWTAVMSVFFVIILYDCLTLPLVNQRVKKHITVLFLITPSESVIISIKFLHKVEMQIIMPIARVEYKVGNEILTGFKSFSSINIFIMLNYFAPFYKPKVCKYKVM